MKNYIKGLLMVSIVAMSMVTIQGAEIENVSMPTYGQKVRENLSDFIPNLFYFAVYEVVPPMVQCAWEHTGGAVMDNVWREPYKAYREKREQHSTYSSEHTNDLWNLVAIDIPWGIVKSSIIIWGTYAAVKETGRRVSNWWYRRKQKKDSDFFQNRISFNINQ
ncbi:MAG: hypothetical protein WBQ73_00490 [Candidatus Babeliales bacterium]